MSSPDLALQKVLFSEITNAIPGVRCEVTPPQNNALPWVHIGESTTIEHPVGWEITATVHVWSDAEGSHECKGYQDAIRAELHGNTYSQDGWSLACAAQRDARCFFDPDDEVWHGVQDFRFFVGA